MFDLFKVFYTLSTLDLCKIRSSVFLKEHYFSIKRTVFKFRQQRLTYFQLKLNVLPFTYRVDFLKVSKTLLIVPS